MVCLCSPDLYAWLPVLSDDASWPPLPGSTACWQLMNPSFFLLGVYEIFPHRVDRQKYHAVALEVFFLYVVDTLHPPVIVRDGVPIDHC